MYRLALSVLVALSFVSTSVEAEDRCNFGTFVCDGDNLSWVKVHFFNEKTEEIVGKSAEQFQQDIRGYMRRELPELKHEVVDPFAKSENGAVRIFNMSGDVLYEKSALFCQLSAIDVGAGTAHFVECNLKSFTDIKNGKNPSFKSELVSSAPPGEADYVVDETFRRVIKRLSDKFYSRLSTIEQAESNR